MVLFVISINLSEWFGSSQLKPYKLPTLPQDQLKSSQIFADNPDFQEKAFVIHRSVRVMLDYEDTTSGDGENSILKHLYNCSP